MSRRSFVAGLAATLLAGCDLVSFTRRPDRIPRIGHLSLNPLSTNEVSWRGFLEGLRENGWVDGRNVVIDWRDGDGVVDRLPRLADELAALRVDVVVTGTVAGVMAATQALSATPVVMMAVSDPVVIGLVPSLARPGGRITGTASLAPQLTAKRIELIKEAMPGISRVAILWNPTNPAEVKTFGEAETAARRLGLQLQSLQVREIEDLAAAVRTAERDRAEALVDGGGPLVSNSRKRILDLASAKRLPVIGRGRLWVEDGALMAYGPNATEQWRRSAAFVDKILRGAEPARMPIELPTTFELFVNLRTAESLGIAFTQSLRDQVTEALR